MGRRRFLLGAIVTVACAGAAGNEPPPAEDPAHPGSRTDLEEVVVTAQRREQNLMQVPISITALDGERLAQLGALDLTYLSQVSPNTTIVPAFGTNNALAAFIRGIGQDDHLAGFESGVGLYVDDVYYARPQTALLDIYDVERLEVLRGPQGTLYGRNTIGGAIRYITRRPEGPARVGLRGRFGSNGMVDGVLDASAPVGDRLFVGGSFASFNHDGFGENLVNPAQRNYEKAVQAARVSAEWAPNENWRFRLSGDWLQDDSDLRRGHRPYPGRYSGAPVLDDVFDTRAGADFPVADATAHGGSFSADWNVRPGLAVRAILASRSDETWKPVDLDGLPTMDVDVSTWDRNRQQTLELQALFDQDRWTMVLGVFGIDATAKSTLDAILGVAGELLGRPGLGNQLIADIGTRSWAFFADMTHELNPEWALTLGVRYTRDRRHAAIRRELTVGGLSTFFGGTARVFAVPSDFDGSETFDRVTPRAVLSWYPRQESLLYVSYSEGFKGGGFDPRGLSSEAPDGNRDGSVSPAEIHDFMRFDPETVESWEVGWKETLFEDRLTSRLALFQADYTDVQIPGAVFVDVDQYIGITTNAASALVRGLEWEGQAVLARDFGHAGSRLGLQWALGFIDASFGEYIDEEGRDISDAAVFAYTPRWSTGMSLQFDTPVSWFGTDGHFALTTAVSWRDDHSLETLPDPVIDQPAFAVWDLGATWSSSSGRWQIGIMARNLSDCHYRVSMVEAPIGLENNIQVFHGNPRQVWLDVQYRFTRN